jgi:acetyltransferase EpsM
MKKLVIFGGKGIGMIAASIARDLGSYEVIGFLNDQIEPGEMIGEFTKFPVLGKSDDCSKFVEKNCYFFIGYVGMKKEKSVFEKISALPVPGDRWADLVHPTAIVPKDFCKIGRGCMIAPLAQLSPDTEISDHCILLGNSFIGHNSFLDIFAHVATNGVVGGTVHVGKAVHIGSNATLREKITIGDFSLIGSGSVVLNDVPEGAVVVGNPARIISK